MTLHDSESVPQREEGPLSGAFFVLCAEGDLNPHALAGTATSTQRVYHSATRAGDEKSLPTEEKHYQVSVEPTNRAHPGRAVRLR